VISSGCVRQIALVKVRREGPNGSLSGRLPIEAERSLILHAPRPELQPGTAD
jgi:hypothetical protein